MSAALLLQRDAYRDEHGSDCGVSSAARAHLELASDALSMALLTLAGDDDDRGDKLRRGQQCRALLAEALTGLSRARVYIPTIRTYTLSVLLATEANPDAELQRLHRLTSHLLWQNHPHLPARVQAKPMAPEEEAQLALVVAGLVRSARIDRALRYKWVGLAGLVAVGGAAIGMPVVGLLAATSAVGMTVWQALHGRHLPAEPTPTRAG